MDDKILEIKNSINELLINLCIRIDDICNGFKINNTMDNDRIINLIDDMNVLSEGINIIKDYYSSIDILELTEKLNMLYPAFESKDYNLFADTMEYELKPLLEYWIDCLKN